MPYNPATMILDRIENASLYTAAHPGFAAAFDYLKTVDMATLADGKHAIDGERVFAIVATSAGRSRAGAKLEAHRKYIDVQYTVTGLDEIGMKPTADCRDVELPFDTERDVTLFTDAPEYWIALKPRTFVVFYPDDAHAPLGGEGDVRKVVVKVAVE